MSSDFNLRPLPKDEGTYEWRNDGFNTRTGYPSDGEPRISLNDAKIAQQLATHDGLIKGVQTSLSSIQSSLSSAQTSFGAWIAVVGIVAAAILGLGISNYNRTNAVGDRIDTVAQRIGGVETRAAAIEGRLGGVEAQALRIEDKVDLLPERIAAATKRPTAERE